MSGPKRAIQLLLVSLFFLGAGVFLYPYAQGIVTDMRMSEKANIFLSTVPSEEPTAPSSFLPTENTVPTEALPPREYPELWEAMRAYNSSIYENGQDGILGSYVFSQTAITLADYGLESEVFGVISIPSLNVSLPLYLGASEQNMADGAAQMGQTSIPIGGINTNCVIAGHRGYGGAAYFRYVDQLQSGDLVQITNLWETLNYRVMETIIIEPNDISTIRIQPGKDMVTLLTCHPYASGGKQRMLILCERATEERQGFGG